MIYHTIILIKSLRLNLNELQIHKFDLTFYETIQLKEIINDSPKKNHKFVHKNNLSTRSHTNFGMISFYWDPCLYEICQIFIEIVIQPPDNIKYQETR